MSTTFAPGSLVRARDREWVVQPGSDDRLLLLAPTGGADNETVGILADLEQVEEATFPWPTPADLGSARTARLLRDAVRAGFRSTAGPFRSLASIAVEPRPYQFVPLMMSMKIDPVRLLIADAVGIGKTIESLLIARELLASGRATGLSVVCPRHLVDQWLDEMSRWFHLEGIKVVPSTARRLERRLPADRSLFDEHPVTAVSLDFIKSERRRHEFSRVAPDLIIVDEAHLCSHDPNSRSARHYRHELLKDVANTPTHDGRRRHMLMATATPHSGKDGAFRSLLTVLNPDLEHLDDADEHLTDADRDVVHEHFVQRKRGDIRHYLGTETNLPEREQLPSEQGGYSITDESRDVIRDVHSWVRRALADADDHQTRTARRWTIVGLLRALASSPAAAAATLRRRAATAQTDDGPQVTDDVRNSVVDTDEGNDDSDEVPGTLVDDEDDQAEQLAAFADRVAALKGPDHDAKLTHATRLVRKLLDDGFNPIVFCRFIDTATYVADHLRDALPDRVAVAAVHGNIPADVRPDRVKDLTASDQRVLVATNCLSEGINLQTMFRAVVHYDLPWSPTKLEQREGRVDRFGQPHDPVRIATIYGRDLHIDQAVIEVLLKKHHRIHSELGVKIPIPASSADVIESLFDRLVDVPSEQLRIDWDESVAEYVDDVREAAQPTFDEWERAAEQESRTRYAQRAIHPEQVQHHLDQIRAALGDPANLPAYVRDAVEALGGWVRPDDDGHGATLGLADVPSELRDQLAVAINPAEDCPDELHVRYEPDAPPGTPALTRTHPVVAAISAHLLDAALDEHAESPAARAAVTVTDAVDATTILVVARHRHDLIQTDLDTGDRRSMLVEEAATYAARVNVDGTLTWLDDDRAEALLAAQPTGDRPQAVRRQFLNMALGMRDDIASHLDNEGQHRADNALEAHRDVRSAAGGGLGRLDARTHTPPDVVGLYVLLADNTGGGGS